MASNKRINKAYIRYDGTGRVIAGALLLNRFKPKGGGEWHEIPAYECCNPSPIPAQSLRLLFSNIEEIGAIVGDVNSVTDWNTFFDLPTYGNPFTSVVVVGNEVELIGGSNIKVKPLLFYSSLIIDSVIDTGSITSVGGDAFSYSNINTAILPECTEVFGYQDSPGENSGGFGACYSLTTLSIPKLVSAGDLAFELISATSVDFPLLTTIGNNCFTGCASLTSINIPSCTNLGSTVGDNNVFSSILGNTITLTVPAALMTCNVGSPDGDIQELQANNTVTVVTV